MEYALFVLVGFAGALISAVFGFGTALFVLVVGAYILPVKETIALAAVLFTVSTVVKAILFRKYIDWRMVFLLTLGSLPLAYVGGSLVATVDAGALRKLLGASVLLFLGLYFSNWKPTFNINQAGLVVGAGIYGFLSGLLGSGNIVKVFMFRELGLTRHAFVGTMAASAVMANISKLTAYTRGGLLSPDHGPAMVGLAGSALCAALIGRVILNTINDRSFQYGLCILICIVAVGLLF